MSDNKASVFLDLDDTILDFHKAEHIALSKALSDLNIEPRQEILDRYSVINQEQWKRLEKGLASRIEILTDRFTILFGELGIDCSGEKARDLYEAYLCIGHYFIDGAPELLEALYGKYDLYMVSNGSLEVQRSRMASADINKYFKKIFISQEIGADKPSTEFFDRCFSQIPDFKRENSVIIGDSLSSDIKGGINAGIRTIWFNPKGENPENNIKPDYSVSNLVEIPILLSNIL